MGFTKLLRWRASNRRPVLGIAFSLFALVLCAPTSLFGQALSSITGTVVDSSGAVVPNAKVTITNDATNVVKTGTTTSAGSYKVTDLIPGIYTVKVENPGFQVSVHNGVGVEVGHESTVDVLLETGNTSQTIEVKEDIITLNTTQPDLNTTIENKVVQELPLQIPGGRGRQIDSLIFLAPGVTGDTFSHRINGGVDFQNEIVFNGVPMAQPETQGFSTIWNPPFELVTEFNVLRSSFSAQYGLAQGVITYQTKSGTNQIHGDAFDIIRNNFFDAKGAYNPTVPIDKENNFGFSIGGPVFLPHFYNGKNRTFFHLSMEWYRQNQTATGFFSLPTPAEKAGDFSALGTTIWNPSGSGCNANGNTPGTPFRNNVIPQACFSAISRNLLQYLPNPTLPGFQNNQANMLGVLPTRQNPWGFTIDHAITDKQSIHWAQWRNKQTGYGEGNQLPANNPLANYTYFPNLGTVFIANYSYTVSPTFVVTVGASWLGEINSQIPVRSQRLGLSSAPGAEIISGINFSGNNSPGSLGTSNSNAVNRKLGLVLDNNYLWIKGKHTFNIGVELRRAYQDDNECQQCAGNFNFSNNQTANPADLANTGNSFASFLLGTVDSGNRTGSQELRLRNFDVSSYIQDDVKWTPKLTFNVGLRWDVMVPFTEVDDLVVYFDSKIPNPGANGLLGAATKFGSCTGCAGVRRADVKWTHFSPRGGFSYKINDKTVLQSGLSVNYLNGGAYEYGISKVAVNYGNLLLGSFTRKSTGSTSPAFGSWDSNVLPQPLPTPFRSTLGNATSINAFDPRNNGIAPYNIVWNIGIQRELPYQMFLSVNYTGNRGIHLPSQLNPINQIPTGSLALGDLLGSKITDPAAVAKGLKSPYPGFVNDFGDSATVLQALRPYPQFAGIFNNFDMTGSARYNALQLQVQKRYTNGLSFLVSYNVSKMMSNTNSGFTSFVSAALNKDNQKAEWSIDNNDQPQILKIAATYELPLGKGRKYMNKGGVANVVLGGWQISPLLTYASGTPLQVTVAGDPLGNGTSNRPNLVDGKQLQFSYSNVYQGLPVLNKAAFSDPGVWVIGNEPRYVAGMRTPTRLNEDIALAKYFPIREKVKLKLEVEFFNSFNRVIFGGPNTSLQDSNFGKVINSQDNRPRQGQGLLELRW